jgi:alkylation response protein AidB-like acyl-CoA dehydrogenase
MDFAFSEEQEMFRDMVRDFAQKEVLPLAETLDREERPPLETVRKAAALDMLGIPFPEKYGGMDMGAVTYTILIEELAKVCASTASTIGISVGVGMMAIYLAGTEEQKQRFLPRLISEGGLAAFALTEPDAGSDAASIRTTAVKDGDAYVLNGSKIWITNADVAQVMTVFAVTDPAAGAKGISAFLVEQGTPGMTIGWRDKKMGMRGVSTCAVFFDNCRVPAANLLGGREGAGFGAALKTLDFGRMSVAASCLGLAQGCVEASVAFARDRQQFGGPIAMKGAIQAFIADMATQVESLRYLVYHTAWLVDSGKEYGWEASTAKLWGSQVATFCANKAVQVHGGMGYMKRFPIERIYRDAKILPIWEGTSEIQRFLIASKLFKEAGVKIAP